MTVRPLPARGSSSKILALCALFGGAGPAAHILLGLSLRLALAGAAVLAVLPAAAVWRRTSREGRVRQRRLVAAGAFSGLAATAGCDLARFARSRREPPPYVPFEAIRVFGLLPAGPSALAAVRATGAAFHDANGALSGPGRARRAADARR